MMADVDRKAIPTLYNGIQFRSRLEAKWAAFFDLMNWRYEYEPFDLDGYIPDFLVMGYKPTLVEVKPVVRFPDDVGTRIARFSEHYELLLVGCSIGLDKSEAESDRVGSHGLTIGWHCEFASEVTIIGGGPLGWTTAELMGPDQCGSNCWDWCSSIGSYCGRVASTYDGSLYLMEKDRKAALSMWNEAGNRVQWRGVQSARYQAGGR
jgi:hypothetical protein